MLKQKLEQSANPHKQWTISSETVTTGRPTTVIVPPLTW
jgi:hypothetical protein